MFPPVRVKTLEHCVNSLGEFGGHVLCFITTHSIIHRVEILSMTKLWVMGELRLRTENPPVIAPQSKSLQLAFVHHVFKRDSCENSLPVIISVFSFSVSDLNFSPWTGSLETMPTFQDLPNYCSRTSFNLLQFFFFLSFCPRCAKHTSS